jgi:hypothetical protein
MNANPDSRMPRKLVTVNSSRITRQSASVCGYNAGKAETSAPTPADIPTATFNM